MGFGPKGAARPGRLMLVLGFGIAGLVWGISLPATLQATHQVDHRFTVEGHVCGADGRPVPDTQVVVKDKRVSEGATVYTNSRGYYKATLHLHNDNKGDPIIVTAFQEEKRLTAEFDVKDVRTERKATVNFGAGCVEEPPSWVYYWVGAGLIAAALIVRRIVSRKHRRQFRQRGKAPR